MNTLELVNFIRDTIAEKLKANKLGITKTNKAMIITNLPATPRITVDKKHVNIRLISDVSRFSGKTYQDLRFDMGDLHDPNTDPMALVDRIISAIDKYIEFCALSDSFELKSPEIKGSTKKAVIRKIVKDRIPKEFRKEHDVEWGIGTFMQGCVIYENGRICYKHFKDRELTPEQVAESVMKQSSKRPK